MLDIQTIKKTPLFSKETLQNNWKAIAILLIGITLSIAAARYIQKDIDQQTKKEFTFVCKDIKGDMAAELHLYSQILRDGAALFAASDTITRREWKTFIDASKIQQNLPLLQGFGFAMIIPNNQLQQHLENIRQEGFPYYSIYPPGIRDSYTSIIYLEPFSGRNLRAFGYDMFSDPERRKAMEWARDEDEASLSSKVRLVQETGINAPPGILMFFPVYQSGEPPKTMAERRAAIKGWVYSPYRLNDLMHQIIGRWDLMKQKRINLKIYEDSISTASLLFESKSVDSAILIQSPYHTNILPLEFNNKKWILVFNQYGIHLPYLKRISFTILIGGIMFSLTLYLLFKSILNTRRKALQMAEDLTIELKGNAERYKELSNMLETIMDAVPGLIFYKDKKNNFIRINNAAAKAYGKTRVEMEGKNLAELSSKEAAEKYYQDDLEVINSGISKLNFEESWETVEGKKWLITSKIPYVNSNGEIIGIIGMSMDITERKQLEKEREIFLTFFKITRDLMVIADPKGWFKKVNPACLQLLGYSEEELLSKPFIDFVHPDDRQATLAEFTGKVKAGQSINFENRYVCKDGTSKNLSWQSAFNVIDGLTFATARDITERKLAEAQILELNKELDKKVQLQSIQNEMVNKELDSFTFSVSHDMRAPLRAINSYAQIISEDYSDQLNKDVMEMLKKIKHNGIKMGRLIDDLLAFSRLGRKELKKDAVNMNELTKNVLNELNQHFPNHAEILVSDLPVVRGDYSLLYQVMFNLIGNAIKYSSKKEKPVINVYLEQKEGKNTFVIKDNGAGFDMRFVDKLFGVFQRLHSQQEFEGNGVGLAIVQRILNKHGGKVWGEGKVNEGATFYFTLN